MCRAFSVVAAAASSSSVDDVAPSSSSPTPHRQESSESRSVSRQVLILKRACLGCCCRQMRFDHHRQHTTTTITTAIVVVVLIFTRSSTLCQQKFAITRAPFCCFFLYFLFVDNLRALFVDTPIRLILSFNNVSIKCRYCHYGVSVPHSIIVPLQANHQLLTRFVLAHGKHQFYCSSGGVLLLLWWLSLARFG